MSNGDKRSVATDALETLGTKIDENQKRDAIHLAVEPVIAGEPLWPAQDVWLYQGKAYHGVPTGCSPSDVKHLGIVDPFIKGYVDKDQRFWLVVYPRQITSLRHVWAHPDFPEMEGEATKALSSDLRRMRGAEYEELIPSADDDKMQQEASEQWIATYAMAFDMSYREMITAANDFLDHGDYVIEQDSDTWRDMFDAETFWSHFEKATGRVPHERNNFFGCSC